MPPFDTLWPDSEAFDRIQGITGEIVKAKDNRRVVRFEVNGEVFFLKHHRGVGYREILKNLLRFKRPVLGARGEWTAIQRLDELGLRTTTLVAYGERGFNPANRESFTITRELRDTITLEKLCQTWPDSPPAYVFRKTLIERVAQLARAFHTQGMNHRDFYLCHILLDVGAGLDQTKPCTGMLYLVDLHRMQIRARLPQRWRVKDIGSLYFSTLDIGLNERDLIRFARGYFAQPVDVSIRDNRSFWRAVAARCKWLAHRQARNLAT